MSRSATVRRRAAAGLALVVAAPTLLAVSAVHAPPAVAVGEDLCSSDVLVESDRTADVGERVESLPGLRMHVPQAHRITRGRGTTVAVVDSGVGALPGKQVRHESVGFDGVLLSGHGTIVAGLVAGPQGVAPEAGLVSVRVLDKDDPDVQRGERGVSSASIAAALDRLAQVHRSQPLDVVNISLAVPGDDPVLAAAVRRLLALDIVVVASAGNVRPDEEGGSSRGAPSSDEEVYPADYPGVVAVSAVGASPAVDVRDHVMPNKETVVAAPGGGGLSYNLNGQKCQVDPSEVATSWAAASVSGVVALLRSRYPDENRRQIVARLARTAEGSELAPNPWTGAGVVQAADALTHELSPKPNGRLPRTEAVVRTDAQAPPPPDRPDVFGASRTMLLWFGLLAGALVALASVVRPLLRRSSRARG